VSFAESTANPDTLVHMARAAARYDQFAEWYEQWTSGFGPTLISAHPELVPPLSGHRVLDLACGHGRLTRVLARAGAKVVGVDFSVALLDRARANDSIGISYVLADVTRTPSWWDGHPFDGCTCELAMMTSTIFQERYPRWQPCCAPEDGSWRRSCTPAFWATTMA
jgi:2-polyprenyl-3-methyl-5-hydroxy-6-metoxy-1,4-benzoquinol methylase